MATFPLKIVSSDRLFFDEPIDMLIARTMQGDIGILSGHIGLVTVLEIGKIRVRQGDKIREAAISGGLLKVLKSGTTIVTPSCEWADEIDVARANAAKEHAQQQLEQIADDEKAYKLMEGKLKRAVNRINIAQ